MGAYFNDFFELNTEKQKCGYKFASGKEEKREQSMQYTP